MEKIEYRAYIKIRVFQDIAPIDIHRELTVAYGPLAPQYSTVWKWADRFKNGRESIEDDPRSGRPVTVYSEANIELVRQLIETNPHATYDEMESETSINRFTIFEIIHSALRLRKLNSRYVPHILTDENRAKRVDFSKENLAYYRDGPGRLSNIFTGDEVMIYWRQLGRKSSNASWVGEGEAPRTVVKRSTFDNKTLFSIFFRATGPLNVHAVNRGTSIDNKYYIKHCLTPAINAIKEDRPLSGTHAMKLLHDGAKPHTAQNVDNFLLRKGIGLVKHPPYSPDLAPCDYWLFDYIKQRLRDHENQISLLGSVTKIVYDIPLSEYKKTFEKWIERLELCVENKGDYFEHLIK
jgi:histone-lysine N-methyltransferase SETMAR